MQATSGTNIGRCQKLQRRSYEVTCTGAVHAAMLSGQSRWFALSSVRSRAKLERDQAKSGKIKGNQGLNSGFTTGTPAPEVNLPEPEMSKSSQKSEEVTSSQPK